MNTDKTLRMVVVVTPKEKQQIEKALEGFPFSTMCRKLLAENLKLDLPPLRKGKKKE
jgi:hypothetical protein